MGMETIARADDGRSRIEESNPKKCKFEDVDGFNKEEEGASSSSLSEENLKKKGKFDYVEDFNKQGPELGSSGDDPKKECEEKEDIDGKEKEKEKEDKDVAEKFRKFSDGEVEKMEVEPHEYAVEQTEEEKRYYESPEYNTTSDVIKKEVEEGSWEFHCMTEKEHEIYRKEVEESEGFDVPLLPGAICPGRLCRINFKWKEEAIFVAKISKLALIYYNKKHGTDYVFKCIEKANHAVTSVKTYYITFKATSASRSDLANTFQAMVHRGVANTEVMKCRIKSGTKLNSSNVNPEKGGEGKDVDEKEENLEEEDDNSELEEDDNSELEEEENYVLEKLRKFGDEEVEKMEVEPHECKVEPTEEEKKYYESPEYNNRSAELKRNIEEGSWEYHYMTKKEHEIYVEEVTKSKGFDIPLLPGAICPGKLCRINFKRSPETTFVVKVSKLALIYYNKKHGTDYVFKCIEKANHAVTAVKTYYITFKATSAANSDCVITFQAMVHQGVIDTEIMKCRIKP
ncbi:hypothetical protein LguiA_022750 [Lonicera macranthoides]